jgi:hypothetical protein
MDNPDDMHKNSLPDTELKLMHQINGEHFKYVELKFGKLLCKRILRFVSENNVENTINVDELLWGLETVF